MQFVVLAVRYLADSSPEEAVVCFVPRLNELSGYPRTLWGMECSHQRVGLFTCVREIFLVLNAP